MKNSHRTSEKAPTRADEVFFDALEYETVEDRDVFLEKSCAGDPALRQEVGELFDSLDAAEMFFADGALLEISVGDFLEALSNHCEPVNNIKSTRPHGDETGN